MSTPRSPRAALDTRSGRLAAWWARFKRTRTGPFGLVLLVLLAMVALLAPVLSPYAPTAVTGQSLQGPSGAHLMGTDNIGRDVLSVVIHGSRVSLVTGLLAAAIALVIGALVGGVAGYYRGPVESVLMRVTELFQTLPTLIIALFVLALWGSSQLIVIIVIGLAIWPLEARIVYGQFVLLREREFTQAAKAAGLRSRTIVFSEILPNAMPPVIVQTSLDVGLAILVQAGLSFLGLGDASQESWGQLLYVAQDYLQEAWWISVFPGAGICLAVLAFNLLGDGLNEVYNPLQVRGLRRVKR